jgi:hypothetical protein
VACGCCWALPLWWAAQGRSDELGLE